MSLQGKTWEAFVALWGGDEEKARQWLADNPQARNRAIEESGLITREEKPEGEQSPTPEPTPAEMAIDDSVIAAVARSVLESEAVTTLTAKLTELESKLGEFASRTKEANETIAKLNDRLAKLEGAAQAEARQIEDDKPPKFLNQPRLVYRPRQAEAVPAGEQAFSDIAKNNMPKGLNY